MTLVISFQHSRTGYHGYSSMTHLNIIQLVKKITLDNILELVTTVTLIKAFHYRNDYHGYSSYIISSFWNWLPWFLLLKHFNIPEMVIMVTLIISFQHSRTGYHGFSDQNIDILEMVTTVTLFT